jgi:hypothetical protein
LGIVAGHGGHRRERQERPGGAVENGAPFEPGTVRAGWGAPSLGAVGSTEAGKSVEGGSRRTKPRRLERTEVQVSRLLGPGGRSHSHCQHPDSPGAWREEAAVSGTQAGQFCEPRAGLHLPGSGDREGSCGNCHCRNDTFDFRLRQVTCFGQ